LKEPLKAAVMARYVILDIMTHRVFTHRTNLPAPLYPPRFIKRASLALSSRINVCVISSSMLAPVTTSLGRGRNPRPHARDPRTRRLYAMAQWRARSARPDEAASRKPDADVANFNARVNKPANDDPSILEPLRLASDAA
jgi:hypothetical protein